MSHILVQSRAFSQKMKTILVPSALAVLLVACSGNHISETLKNEAYANSEFYINKADQSNKIEEQQTYRLLAVRKLIDENKSYEAQNTFAELNAEKLNELQKLEYQLLSAQLAALQGNDVAAIEALKSLPQHQLSQSQLLRVYRTQAKVAENRKDVIETVRALAFMDNYLTDNQSRQENNDKIWSLLRSANRGMIDKARAEAGELGLAGWLALVQTYNRNMNNPSALPQLLENWKNEYPNHSANRLMPSELKDVQSFQQTQLNGVALFLPLSEDASTLGQLIKRGFDDAKGADSIPVKVYDTDSKPLEDLITDAKNDGVQTIIGPLLKSRVDEMVASAQIGNVNVLALNSTPNVKAISRVCYYGLSPEAEAKAAAERFFRDGISHALVATPQGDFGQRSADAFAQRWRQLTGKDADIRYYNEPLDSVASLQNSAVGAGAGLYALGTAEQVLQIKQELDASQLANQFPIYTSSRSNSSHNDQDFRLAMEGVKFSEIPLLADVSSDEYRKAGQLADNDFAMMRLYAMGSDAWSIANKFNEFRQIPGYKVSGLTGILSAGRNCNIEREMSWLQYRAGEVVSAN